MDPDETWHAGRPRPWPHYVRSGPSSLPKNGGTASIFGPCLLWPNGWMHQDATWYGGSLGAGRIVLDGNPAALPPKRGHSSLPRILGPCLLWPNGWMDQDATWCGGRPRPRPHCARWGPSSPQKGRTAPQFLAHVCCNQMAGWIKIPPSTKVGLGPGHIVLHRDPASPIRGTAPSNFWPMSIVTKWSPISATAEHLLV